MTRSLSSLYQQIANTYPQWSARVGVFDDPSWVDGCALQYPDEDPLRSILAAMADKLQTPHKKVVAASWVLRVSWSSGIAIAPTVLYGVVPDIRLDNIAIAFDQQQLFKALSFKQDLAVYQRIEEEVIQRQVSPRYQSPPLCAVLTSVLRSQLIDQMTPIVNGLHQWSGLSKRAMWGQIASSWATQWLAVHEAIQTNLPVDALVASLFDTDHLVATMKPDITELHNKGATVLCERRASCCLYYQVSNPRYFCDCCPLISDKDRYHRYLSYI